MFEIKLNPDLSLQIDIQKVVEEISQGKWTKNLGKKL
jgi:hypothetical protein